MWSVRGKIPLGGGGKPQNRHFGCQKCLKFDLKMTKNTKNIKNPKIGRIWPPRRGGPPRIPKSMPKTQKPCQKHKNPIKNIKNIKNPSPGRVRDPRSGGGTPPEPGGGPPPWGPGSYINASPTRKGVFFRPLPLRAK